MSNLNLKNWFLVSYHSPSTHLVSGSRLKKLHQFLKRKKTHSTLITRRSVDVAIGEIAIEEPGFVTHFDKLLSAFAIPDISIFWSLKVFHFLKKKEAGVLLTTMPYYGLSIIGLLNTKRENRHFWIADFRDSWLLNPLYHPFLFFIKKPFLKLIEKAVFKHADLVVFNTETDLQNHLNKYTVLKNKSISIPNGFDKIIPSQHDQYLDHQEITLVYAGNHYPGDVAVKKIIDWLNLLNQTEERVICHVYGKPNSKWDNCPYTLYKGLKSQEQIATILSHYKMGVIYLQPECIGGGRMPQKFYDYIGSGVIPIVINASGELMKHLPLFGGVVLDLNSQPQQLVTELKKLYRSDVLINDDLLKKYTRKSQFEKLYQHINVFYPDKIR